MTPDLTAARHYVEAHREALWTATAPLREHPDGVVACVVQLAVVARAAGVSPHTVARLYAAAAAALAES